MAQKMIKMWVSPEVKANVNLKQDKMKRDLGVKVPKHKILLALTRQPLFPESAGLDLTKMRRTRK